MMNRRDVLTTVGASTLAIAGCTTRHATHSEVEATGQVTEIERHDTAVTAHIEVVSDSSNDGTVGLHVHYWTSDCGSGSPYHTHMPSVHVPSGEVVTIQDAIEHDSDAIECVSAHIHE